MALVTNIVAAVGDKAQAFVVDLADAARGAASQRQIVPAWVRTVNG